MSVNPVFPVVFNGGQMTDLPKFTGTLDGTELMEIVAAGTGQSVVADGVNYQITTTQLAALLNAMSIAPTFINNGEHTSPGDPFIPTALQARIWINKTIAEPTYIQFAASNVYSVEPLVQDIRGALDGVTGIVTCTFSNGELANGLATVPIRTAYGGYFFRPIASKSLWMLGTT